MASSGRGMGPGMMSDMPKMRERMAEMQKRMSEMMGAPKP
jgi:hypothetical protein